MSAAIAEVVPLERVCSKCGERKPVADFRKKKGRWCAACWSAYQKGHYEKTKTSQAERKKTAYQADPAKCRARTKAWRAANAEKKRTASRQYWDENPERVMLTSARKRAKRSGLAFAIRIADICIPEFCPVLGIRLVRRGGHATPSLDRINSALGYVPGNVAVISLRANVLKSNATASELERVVQWMRMHGAP